MSRPEGALVIACGALARELEALTRGLPGIEVEYLPATLHNRPERITDAVVARVRAARERGYERVLVGYMDCGTGGLLDAALAAEGVERLPGAHCYELYAGRAAFAALHDEEPGTFYLTDFLVRSFEGLVWRGLGLDRHPELRDLYFANYRRVIYLAQGDDPELVDRARRAAERLGLAFQLRRTGLDGLAAAVSVVAGREAAPADSQSTNRARRVDRGPAESRIGASC